MRTFTIAAITIVLLTACGTITVNRNDTTPPALTVSLIPSTIDARYSDNGEVISGEINPHRDFTIHPLLRQRMQLLFVARDQESSINNIQATLNVTFQCAADWLGRPVEQVRTVSKTFTASDSFGTPSEGDSAPAGRGVTLPFSLVDLWIGECQASWRNVSGDDGAGHVSRGYLTDIQFTYTATAENNSSSAPLSNTITGQFSDSVTRRRFTDLPLP